jgi:hypothetical protein
MTALPAPAELVALEAPDIMEVLEEPLLKMEGVAVEALEAQMEQGILEAAAAQY